ncbi:MAG: hypothetical protein R3B82_03755 [Sandaracinaceae bacterium]
MLRTGLAPGPSAAAKTMIDYDSQNWLGILAKGTGSVLHGSSDGW